MSGISIDIIEDGSVLAAYTGQSAVPRQGERVFFERTGKTYIVQQVTWEFLLGGTLARVVVKKENR